jgi:hypothetical protein
MTASKKQRAVRIDLRDITISENVFVGAITWSKSAEWAVCTALRGSKLLVSHPLSTDCSHLSLPPKRLKKMPFPPKHLGLIAVFANHHNFR